ncbi:hypothetical protein H5410_052030 [Solanum commersonii]|uniref:SWIM-type domain-containing protein n=1 Tax=Solanum commersonii TaxID=4109 RepID=A0A9J5X024_SOLCO|nr:hypothetical protein H5410_052030 [Solanum commersonii]
MMWDYCNEMDRTNLGSTIRMKFTDNEVPGQPYRFQRIYICFAACKFSFKAGFGSFSLKKALWAAAKATTVQQVIVCMNHMFELDPNVAAWCNEKEPSQCTMAYFSSDAKYDMLLNNLCEIKDILLKNQKADGEYIPRKSNQWNCEITGASIMDNWAVDLEKRTCSCRKWSLTGIPCKHTIAAIWANREDTLDYVHDSYKVETYRKIYENAIFPMNDPQMWPKSNKLPPLPPRSLTSTKRGRKQKKIRKEADEVGANCSTCHKSGHNKRTCKTKDVQPETTSSVCDKLHVRQRCSEVQQENMKQREVGQGEEMNSSWENSQQTQQSGFLLFFGVVSALIWCCLVQFLCCFSVNMVLLFWCNLESVFGAFLVQFWSCFAVVTMIFCCCFWCSSSAFWWWC